MTWTDLQYMVVEERLTLEGIKECKADVNNPTSGGSFPLHFAALNGDLEAVELLLDFGASIDARNKYGETALHWACRFGSLPVVTYLLEVGADITICDSDMNSVLHWAAEYDHPELVRYLIVQNVNQAIKNVDDLTAYQVALENESYKAARVFKSFIKSSTFSSVTSSLKKALRQRLLPISSSSLVYVKA